MRKFKHSQEDLTAKQLPQNRKEVFFDVLKNNWGKLLTCSFIILLFSLPLHFTAIARDIYQMNIQAEYESGKLTLEAANVALQSFALMRSLLNIAFYALFAVGFAAVARIIKLLAWEENVSLRHDFIKGIKQNTLQYLIIALIFGLIEFVINYYGMQGRLNDIWGTVGIVITVVFAVLLAPPACYAIVCISIYTNKFSQNVKLSFYMYFKSPFKNIGVLLALYGVFAVQLIPFFLCHVIGRIVSTILSGFIFLIWFLYASSMLDKHLNGERYPELVNKGVLGKQFENEKF